MLSIGLQSAAVTNNGGHPDTVLFRELDSGSKMMTSIALRRVAFDSVGNTCSLAHSQAGTAGVCPQHGIKNTSRVTLSTCCDLKQGM